MKLKFIYATQADIPEAFRSLYVEKDGKWTLDVEGATSVERVTEFRDKNILLQKEVTDLKATWDGFDAAEVKALIAKKADIEAQKAKDKGELDKLIDERTAQMKAAAEKEKATLTESLAKANASLNRVVIEKSLIEHATKLGLRDGAAEDLVARGSRVFKLEDDKPVAYGPDGKALYDAAAAPLTIEGWLQGLTKAAPFLFNGSAGGGSQGGAGGGGGGGQGGAGNPFKAGATFNMTAAGQLLKSDPATARRLAAEAGFQLPAAT